MIGLSYWRHETAARSSEQVAEHLVVQRRGLQPWYIDCHFRVATVERDYGPADSKLRSVPA